jgi:hypothetical protein
MVCRRIIPKRASSNWFVNETRECDEALPCELYYAVSLRNKIIDRDWWIEAVRSLFGAHSPLEAPCWELPFRVG